MTKQLTVIGLFLLAGFAAMLFLWELTASIPTDDGRGIPSFHKVVKLQKIVLLGGE